MVRLSKGSLEEDACLQEARTDASDVDNVAGLAISHDGQRRFHHIDGAEEIRLKLLSYKSHRMF